MANYFELLNRKWFSITVFLLLSSTVTRVKSNEKHGYRVHMATMNMDILNLIRQIFSSPRFFPLILARANNNCVDFIESGNSLQFL